MKCNHNCRHTNTQLHLMFPSLHRWCHTPLRCQSSSVSKPGGNISIPGGRKYPWVSENDKAWTLAQVKGMSGENLLYSIMSYYTLLCQPWPKLLTSPVRGGYLAELLWFARLCVCPHRHCCWYDVNITINGTFYCLFLLRTTRFVWKYRLHGKFLDYAPLHWGSSRLCGCCNLLTWRQNERQEVPWPSHTG